MSSDRGAQTIGATGDFRVPREVHGHEAIACDRRLRDGASHVVSAPSECRRGEGSARHREQREHDGRALEHARSACAASGLNDFDLLDLMGQRESQVQTAADSWKYYGLPKGAPGTLGLCRGNAEE
jgi:hypothetical protein